MKFSQEEIKKLSAMANAVRFLSVDAVEKANSGHPGMPMGIAEVATILFSYHMRFDPQNPNWENRDRFILSAGHGSMLIYSILYLLGYSGITLEDIKNFRQLGAPTAGHPEYNEIPGIETTTGPLGQGLANGLGMAISEELIKKRMGEDIINHYTYVLAGDGCMMEGISHEFASLAGHLSLSNLIVLYDDNKISIDGPTSLTMSDDTLNRYFALGWDVSEVDGYNFDEINQAITNAKKNKKPSLIACKTKIGYGSPSKAGTSGSHGSPLGKEEVLKSKSNLDWNYEAFELPQAVKDDWLKLGKKSRNIAQDWDVKYKQEVQKYLSSTSLSEKKIEQARKIIINEALANQDNIASRKSSELVLNQLISENINLIGGSADLTGSNNTLASSMRKIEKNDFSGNYIHWGVREHCMAAAMNGIALHGFFIPYGGTFLVFSDYCRPAIRLAALMKQQVIFVFTHDSIGLGEDGPTHQPIEHLASLRLIPNLKVFRPCDTIETAECWELALKNRAGPSIIALSRQNLPLLRNSKFNLDINYSAQGIYSLIEFEKADVNLIATGSEVHLAYSASLELKEQNIKANVFSVPSIENINYKERIYKNVENTKSIFIEAGLQQSWDNMMKKNDVFIGLKNFGASGPGKELFNHFGITVSRIVDEAKKIIN